jgi:C4-dicarboxylate transporter DctM subunit
MPVIILGGIYGGFFTPTEAATIAVFYAIMIGLFVTKKLELKQLPQILFDSAATSSVLMLVVGMATVLSRILTILQIPVAIANTLTAMTSNKIVFLLLLNIILLIVGCLMDLGAAVVMFVPCLLPLANQMGIDLVQFGAIVTINLIIGFFTPPVGVCLYVGTSVGNVTLEELCKVILPFVFIGIVLCLIVTFVPAVTLWLPHMMGY